MQTFPTVLLTNTAQQIDIYIHNNTEDTIKICRIRWQKQNKTSWLA